LSSAARAILFSLPKQHFIFVTTDVFETGL
jgi:hypothetical protein